MKKLNLNVLLILLSVLGCVPSEAQLAQRYLIEAGKLFDAEHGKFLKDMVILVDGQMITSVATKKSISDTERREREIIDLNNYTVLPGLIDAHTHLLNREIVKPGMESYPGLDLVRTIALDGDAYRALYGAAKAKAYLDSGITTVQDLGNSGLFADLALKRAISEGLLPGPRMICSGPGLAAEGGQIEGLTFGHTDMASKEYRIVESVDDGIQAVRENINQGVDVIKIYSNNTPNRTILSIDEMQAIVNEAHKYGVRVTAHATSNQAVYNAVISGVDGIDHGYQIEDSTLALMATKRTILIPTDGDSEFIRLYLNTLYPNNSSNNEKLNIRSSKLTTRLHKALEFGVIVAAGSDDYSDVGLPFASPSKTNLIGYFEEGMTIPQILIAATTNAAYHLNRGNDLGKISKGFIADIIAVDNKIETDIKAIMKVHFVMKDGAMVINTK